MAELKPFSCLRCYYCCYFAAERETPTLLPWEKRLLQSLLSSRRHAISKKVRFRPALVFEDEEGTCVVALYKFVVRGFCPFYDISVRACLIHEVKPLACRMYPLILDASSGKVLLSSKCKWVEQNPWVRELNAEDLFQVFPRELRAALEAFLHVKAIDDICAELGLRPSTRGLDRCRQLMDLDAYVARKR